jgi:hypothetical protein
LTSYEIARELRQQLEENDTLSKGWLQAWLLRHSAMLNEHGWILSSLATLLLTWGSGQPLSWHLPRPCALRGARIAPTLGGACTP